MILITGASRGIGKFLLEKYVAEGEDVFGTYYLTKPRYDMLKYYTHVQIDDSLSIKNWIESIENKSRLILINCAGVNYNCYAHKADINSWEQVVKVNLFGTFNVIRNILPYMRNQNFGRIINISSIVAQQGVPGTSAYATSKSGLWGLAKSIAVENANKGVTINTLNLGYFNIGMIQEVSLEIQKNIKKKLPTGKFGNPENIFNAINFLIESDYVNGSTIDINGAII